MVDQKSFDAELAKRARATYMREYRKQNKERIKEINDRCWAKKFESDMMKEVEQRTNEEEARC